MYTRDVYFVEITAVSQRETQKYPIFTHRRVIKIGCCGYFVYVVNPTLIIRISYLNRRCKSAHSPCNGLEMQEMFFSLYFGQDERFRCIEIARLPLCKIRIMWTLIWVHTHQYCIANISLDIFNFLLLFAKIWQHTSRVRFRKTDEAMGRRWAAKFRHHNRPSARQSDVKSRRKAATYSSSKPLTWRIRICLTIVLLPDSPAP